MFSVVSCGKALCPLAAKLLRGVHRHCGASDKKDNYRCASLFSYPKELNLLSQLCQYITHPGSDTSLGNAAVQSAP